MLWAGLLLSVLSGVSAAPVSVSVRFGGSVSLPCDGSAYRGAPVGSLSLLWQTPTRRVWAFRQGRAAPGPGFENRTEVSRDGLPRGDFSLSLHRARLSDEDTYECFREGEDGSRTFLGDVRLTVVARRDTVTLQAGASLSVPLLTGEPVEVLFDPAGSGGRETITILTLEGDWVSFEPRYHTRVLVKHKVMTLYGLTPADQGTYTVLQLDTRRALSTVQLTVHACSRRLTLQAGASLSVPLITGEPVEVLFDPAGSGDWTSVCSVQSSTASCVPQYRDRVSVDNQELRLQELRASDQGSYTVRDLQGNTISTAIVTVEARRDNVTLQAGASLSVPLLTGEPVEVLFDPAGSGGRETITILTLEGGWVSFEHRYHTRVLVKHEVMTLYGLTPADQGTYTVLQLDTRRALSTVQLTVHGAGPANIRNNLLFTFLLLAILVLFWFFLRFY
ncbi:CD276 antigen-like isoform X1 [Lepisosteus oculatus]|uniref:CD276 antigen-like isoform X1 n=1 Tax=Lepisosteus oculatus TaxID=7918 RepID=UPI0035F525D5